MKNVESLTIGPASIAAKRSYCRSGFSVPCLCWKGERAVRLLERLK